MLLKRYRSVGRASAIVCVLLVGMAAHTEGVDIVRYRPERFDRFEAGTFPGTFENPPIVNPNLLDPLLEPGIDLDFSGVGWTQPVSDYRRTLTMITDQHFVSSNHFRPFGSAFFLNRDGQHKTYSVDTNFYSQGMTTFEGQVSDLIVGRLTAPVSAADKVSAYPLLNLEAAEDFVRRQVLVYGIGVDADASPRVGVNNIYELDAADGNEDDIVDTMVFATRQQPRWGRTQVEKGDSGAPSFIVHENRLTLIGTHYTIVSNLAGRPGTSDSFLFSYRDQVDAILSADAKRLARIPTTATVVGRHVFYNDSRFDGDDPMFGAADDAAIATDKTALLPGQTGAFANYTSFSRGLNGIVVDFDHLANPYGLGPEDFTFLMGNDDNPSTWRTAPGPLSVDVRQSVAGHDRVTIVWPDNAVENQWLQVTVLANETTGLGQSDVFYFGSSIGETGNSAVDALVDELDELRTRSNPTTLLDIENPYDFNRDGRVNAWDQLVARTNRTTSGRPLRLISVPALTGALQTVPEPSSLACLAVVVSLVWRRRYALS